ncbi:DUF6471 domain-containing protein [Iodobacter sp. CM08]|uniref:DUF6471 domain-containing protein n=1 Tax=Iodobacter sp. CM08 TaxID=3085902 RepID=UPI0029816D06|nr:DUF6471 domain-containing protein [Iodobacter sp. CM08]MDW5418195.1 DUF6471 domain-containing protein [Iodobacter sp. CM08]
METDTRWVELAARVVRVALARKNCSYAELSTALEKAGVLESERGLATRVSRGRIKAALLFQIIDVIHAKLPLNWETSIVCCLTWEAKVRAVISIELARHPSVTINELAQRMIRLGANMTEKTLVIHLQSGSISLPELLQCLVALGSSSLELYIDYEDLLAVAYDSVTPV